MQVDTRDLISVTEAGNRGISKLVSLAEGGHTQVLLRNSKPVAAIVDMHVMERLQLLDELEDDLRLLTIALARTVLDTGKTYTLDEVAAEFGVDLNEDGEDELIDD